MGVETENYEIAAKRFENTFRAIGFGFRGRGTPEGIFMTATQKCDPKQTHPSEGAMKFCANHRGRNNLKFQAQASARGLP